MRSYWWCLVLPAFLNCSGQNVVAGREKTKAEQLESSLPKWCQATCSKLQQCEEDAGCECSEDVCECTGVDDDCAEDCAEELSTWASGSDECAAIGERIKSCIDGLGCDALGANGGDCNPTAEERDACQKSGEVDPPSGGPGPSTPSGGGSISTGFAGSYTGPIATGGTVAVGGGPSVGGAAYGAEGPGGNGYGNAGHGGRAEGGAGTSGEPVTCDGQSASGQAGSSNSATLCEAGYSECSDDHTYDYYCVKTSEYKSVCSCLVDGSLTRAFEWNESCPEVLQVNVACGWNLVN